MKEVQKPITVARAEFVTSMTTLINDSGLPPFIIESVLRDMLYDVKAVAQKQLERDTALYHDMLAAACDKENEPQCGD